MSVSYAAFIAEFTEFSSSSIQTIVEAKLADAHLLHSESAWGNLYDIAVKYTAADLVAMTPPGMEMALRNADGETVYSATFKRLIRPRNARRGMVL